ncbi:hypothetical protein [Amycolatopsis sp. FDAARGOS 1241]|uniref:hypothetical protein n=1 Tax=Amycolatopsis sp. FDAARGOS 1241 TaxID=2778070 RepID=UPI001951ED78|nr:hypothetical protein [Amycolatopsis sp. FDAARGOS 1241]QRP49806.1 hypothetical protein I6J71_19935 [Amycolatopsis sp. FDAARGOS 1241]
MTATIGRADAELGRSPLAFDPDVAAGVGAELHRWAATIALSAGENFSDDVTEKRRRRVARFTERFPLHPGLEAPR